MKYILTDNFDEDVRVYIYRSKDEVINHLLTMLGEMTLERVK